jgi:hypothetical protein
MAHRTGVKFLVVFAAVAALGVVTGLGQAQVGEGKQIEGVESLEPGWKKHNQTYYPLMRGDKKASPKEMQEIAKAVSQWYVYRLTFHTNKNIPANMATVVKQFEDDMRIYVLPSKNPEFQRIYAKELIGCFKNVLALEVHNPGDQPAIFNACALLPTLAKVKTDEVTDFMIELVENPKTHDSIKLWAMKSMSELPPVRMQGIVGGANPRLASDLKRVNILLEFLKRETPKNVTPEAERFLRRQAIRSLAQTEAPAVEIDKVNKVNGPVAYGLLKVLARNKEALNPPASLTERMEAAIGICNLKFNSKAEPRELYQPDVGLYLTGLFMADFVNAYRADFPRFGSGLVLKKGKKDAEATAIPVQPWKTHAKRLETAFAKLVENSKTTPVDEKCKKFESACKNILKQMQDHKAVEPFDLGLVESTLRPKEATIFRKAKDPEPDFLSK